MTFPMNIQTPYLTFPSRLPLAAACLLALLAMPYLQAQSNYTWDVATGDSAITDGSGTWQVGVGNWYNGTSYDQNWANGNNAIFGGGTAGAAGTVTLGGDVTTANMTFNTPNGGGAYTLDLAGHTLTLGGIITSTSVDGTVLSNGTISLDGNRNILLSKTLTIDAKISGGYNLSTTSNLGNLYLNNTDNDFTGTLSKSNSGWLILQNISDSGVASSAGAGSGISIATNTSGIRFEGAAGSTNRTITLGGSGSSKTIENNGTGALVLAGSISSSMSASLILTLSGNYSGANEIQGVLANRNATVTLGVTKAGSTTWILSGNNTYTGATTISDGTLIVNGSLAAGSALTVASGATLGGTGTINGDATVNGNLRPGNSPGVLSFGSSLTLTSTSEVTMELNGTTRGSQYDGIDVTGALTYSGALIIDVGSAFLGSTESFSLFTFASQSGGFDSVSLAGAYGTGSFVNASGLWSLTDSSGNQWSFSQTDGNLGFTAVPEPSTWALLVLFGVACAGWKIRTLKRDTAIKTGNPA